jgi:hypothetical protein
MKWVLIAVAVIVGLGLLVFVIGALLPTAHVATIEAEYGAPAERVFDTIADVQGGVAWRTGVEQVEVLSAPGEPLRWREKSSFGTLTFRREEYMPPSRLIGRIDDTSQGFGGRWIYEVTPHGERTMLRITEEGEVYNPVFRFMSRYVFGHYRTLEQYARDLGRHFGENVVPVRASGA